MGCTEPPNKGLDQAIEGINDVSSLQSLLINDDGLSNLLELHIQCSNLKNMDLVGLSDPMVVVSVSNKNKYNSIVYFQKLEERK